MSQPPDAVDRAADGSGRSGDAENRAADGSGRPRTAAGRSAGGEVLLRVLGGVLVFAGGWMTALLAVLLVPLRVADAGEVVGGLAGLAGTGFGSVRVPTAVLLAVGGNLVLVRLAESVTGARWGGLLPGLGWFSVVVAALRTTPEGDQLLVSGDWVAALTLFGGTTVLVIATVLGLTAPSGPHGPTRRVPQR